MAEALDLDLAVGALAVADRHLYDAQVLLGGAEEQVEVAKGVEVAEELPARPRSSGSRT